MINRLIQKYPWINFVVNLEGLPINVWTQLGSCCSKCKHLSQVPLKPAVRESLHLIYLAKGAMATTAIEGNTLTEEDVRLRIENKLKLPPSKEYLGTEVDNILSLCNGISDDIANGKAKMLTVEKICYYNNTILHGIPLKEEVIPGKLRQHGVGVGAYKAPHFKDVPALLENLCKWLNSSYFESSLVDSLVMSIIKAIITHLYIAWIHPFGDGNGRVARILEFEILLRGGVPTPAAHLLSNHYNATRSEYYRQLDLSSKRNDALSFTSYATQGFLDGLNEQLERIYEQTISIFWESYIYEIFSENIYPGSKARAKRLRTIMLSLSKKSEPVSTKELFALDREILECYKGKSAMTYRRDLLELIKLDIIKYSDKKMEAKKEKILKYIPKPPVDK